MGWVFRFQPPNIQYMLLLLQCNLTQHVEVLMMKLANRSNLTLNYMEACSAMSLLKIKHEIKHVFFLYWHIIREKLGTV